MNRNVRFFYGLACITTLLLASTLFLNFNRSQFVILPRNLNNPKFVELLLTNYTPNDKDKNEFISFTTNVTFSTDFEVKNDLGSAYILNSTTKLPMYLIKHISKNCGALIDEFSGNYKIIYFDPKLQFPATSNLTSRYEERELKVDIDSFHDHFIIIDSKFIDGANELVKSISQGVLPIIKSSNVENLPLISSYYDWNKAVIIVEDSLLQDNTKLMKNVISKYGFVINEMKQYGIKLLSFNFKNGRALADNINEYIHYQLHHEPMSKKIKADYVYEEQKNLFDINSKNDVIHTNKFTAVILFYKRQEALLKLLQELNKCKSLERILIVCNNQNTASVPHFDYWKGITKQVFFIKTNVNSLNNRFLPYNLINTEAVLSLDEEQRLSNTQLEYYYESWKSNKDSLVGYYSRKTDKSNGMDVYVPKKGKFYDLILTGHTFTHVKYLYAYTYNLHNEMLEFIAKNFNCEDLAFNFIVSIISNKPNYSFTKGSDLGRNMKASEIVQKSISSKINHYTERNECIGHLIKLFGFNPLIKNVVYLDSYD